MKQVDILEIEESWYDILKTYFDSPYFLNTMHAFKEDAKFHITYPENDNIFNAYNSCKFEDVKVVILGQDPYHGKNQGHGLAFSVQEGIALPPSLKNIFIELDSDLGENFKRAPEQGCLQAWANQGVLLLNSVLTVREHEPLSHSKIGWQLLTDHTITQLSLRKQGIVFLLWGKYAQEKEYLINKSLHHVLKAAHPSPFSARYGFFGCKHFSKTNKLLEEEGLEPINWEL